jgi:hypothetical protein
MAAKVDPFDQKYWDEKVKPVLEQHKEVVEFIGEVNETEKRLSHRLLECG